MNTLSRNNTLLYHKTLYYSSAVHYLLNSIFFTLQLSAAGFQTCLAFYLQRKC